MKKILFISSIMFLTLGLQAQSHYSIAAGIKLLKADDRTFTFWYVDESPSMDNMYIQFEQESNLSYMLNFRIQENDPDKQFLLFTEGQGYFGSISGLALNFGYLYSSDFESRFRLQPELSGLLGYCSVGLGEIQNNDVYIQVNDTRFQDYSNVNVSLRNIYLGLKPGLSFVSYLGNNKEIGLGISYQISYKFGKVTFTGIGEDGEEAKDSEKLTEDNVSFTVDGEETDKLPFTPDGLEFKVFFSF